MLLAFLATSETSMKNVVKCYGCVFLSKEVAVCVFKHVSLNLNGDAQLIKI